VWTLLTSHQSQGRRTPYLICGPIGEVKGMIKMEDDFYKELRLWRTKRD